MAKDLTTSKVDRQNVLNNDIALPEIQSAINIKCVPWDNKLYLTKDMVASFFGVDARTVERCISNNREELESNGYIVLRGANLKSFLEEYKKTFATDINVGRKATQEHPTWHTLRHRFGRKATQWKKYPLGLFYCLNGANLETKKKQGQPTPAER